MLFACKKKKKKIKKKKDASSTGSQLQKPPQFNSCWAQNEPKNKEPNIKFKLSFLKKKKKFEKIKGFSLFIKKKKKKKIWKN